MITAGVATVASIPDTGTWNAQSGIHEEPQEADPGVNGLSLLEYMDLIASEETADKDENSADEQWMSKLVGPETEACTKSEMPEQRAHTDKEHNGNHPSVPSD